MPPFGGITVRFFGALHLPFTVHPSQVLSTLLALGVVALAVLLLPVSVGADSASPIVLRDMPGGRAVGTITTDTAVTEIVRKGAWSKVRVEGWIPVETFEQLRNHASRASPSFDAVVGNPEAYRTAAFTWNVRFVELRRGQLTSLGPEEWDYAWCWGPGRENHNLSIALPTREQKALFAPLDSFTTVGVRLTVLTPSGGFGDGPIFALTPETTAFESRAGPGVETTPSADAAGPETAQPPAPSGKAMIRGDVVNVRFGPGTSYSILRRLARGTVVTVAEQREDWSRITLRDGRSGWISTEFLDVPHAQREKGEKKREKEDGRGEK